ncbi:MAG: SMC-Scp complex subunit ScpB [archaeon]
MDAKRIAEAALFMSPDPLTINELTKVMGVDSFSLSLKIMEDLMKEFNARDSALEIVKTESGKYMMRLRAGYSEKVSHLAVSADFSKAVLRTLGLIAVKQPVKQSLIVKIIGNKAYDYINELTEKGFLQAKKEGNTKLLLTTSKFESYFGRQADEIKKMSNQAYQSTLPAQ